MYRQKATCTELSSPHKPRLIRKRPRIKCLPKARDDTLVYVTSMWVDLAIWTYEERENTRERT